MIRETENKEFNPTKEEFEEALNVCFNYPSLRYYFGATRSQVNKYVYKNYRMSLDDLFRVHRVKNNIDIYNINKAEFERMLSLFFTMDDICKRFNMSQEEVDRWCKRVYNKEFSVLRDAHIFKSRVLLREAQMQNVYYGDTQSQIWMGKNYDEQSDPDKKVIEATITEQVPYEEPQVFKEVLEKLGGK